MSLAKVESKVAICTQGTVGIYFYIIKEGTLSVSVNEEKVKQLTSGDSFGEIALLHGALRTASIISETVVELYVLERKTFRKITDHLALVSFEENMAFIQTIPILNNLENDHKVVLCNHLIKEIYDKGVSIVKGSMIIKRVTLETAYI